MKKERLMILGAVAMASVVALAGCAKESESEPAASAGVAIATGAMAGGKPLQVSITPERMVQRVAQRTGAGYGFRQLAVLSAHPWRRSVMPWPGCR